MMVLIELFVVAQLRSDAVLIMTTRWHQIMFYGQCQRFKADCRTLTLEELFFSVLRSNYMRYDNLVLQLIGLIIILTGASSHRITIEVLYNIHC